MKSWMAVAVTGITVACFVVGAPQAQADENAFLYGLSGSYFLRIFGAQKMIEEGHKVCATLAGGPVTPEVIDMVQVDLSVPLNTAQDIVNTAFNKLPC